MGKWEMVRLGDVCEKASSNIAQKDLENNYGNYPIYGASGLIKHVDFYKQADEYIAIVKDGAGIGRTTLMPAKSSVIGTMQYVLPRFQVIDIKYLCFAITHMNLAKYFTGATIPHIYFKDYCKEQLPLPPLDEQKRIAKNLDLASEIVKGYKEQLAELDKLVQSVFYEMFGDPVTNEKGWEVKKLREIYRVGSSKRIYQSEQEACGVPFLRISDLVKRINTGFNDGDLYISPILYETLKRKALVPEANDILITSRGTLGLCYIVKESDRFYFQDGMISWLHKQNTDVQPNYITALFSNSIFRRNFDKIQTGTTVSYLSIAQLSEFNIIFPSFRLQTKFASIVTEIEAQKAQVQQTLTEAENLFNSLMQEYFE